MRAKEFITENFADGKKPGRKGLAKRSGVNTKASVSSLRKTAKNSSGEKQRMAHWLANMKAGRAKKKTNESVDFEQMQPQNIIAVAQQTFAKLYPNVKLYGKSVVEGVGLTTHKGGAGSASAFAGGDTRRGEFYLTLNAYAEGDAMIVVIEDATAGNYKGAATAIIKSLFEAGERLYKTEQRELVVNDNSNYDAWSTIADRVGAELL